ncbi:MAG: hypothetical protein J6B92_08550 [Paraprevotella sp.]|nr:hypothetical protein [Paraprevotella sp.]MBP3472006.1 hypothetical protein [Paraprevotella sp.]
MLERKFTVSLSASNKRWLGERLIEEADKKKDITIPQELVAPAKSPAARPETRQYSPRIMHLRSLRGNGITPEEIETDERLAYLLNR